MELDVRREQRGVSSIGEDILNAIEMIPSYTVEAIAALIGAITTAHQAIRTVATGIAAAVAQDAVNKANAQYMNVPLSPAVLADMAIRNLSIGEAGPAIPAGLAAEAALSGLNAERFAAYVLDTGESYGVIDALRLWHRGTYLTGNYGITEDELNTVVYYSRIRDQFLPDLKLLSWNTMSEADAINTYVKGKATEAQALAWFQAAGGMQEQFNVLYESAGDAIGVEKAAEMYSFGVITEAQLNAVLGQSRMNPAFYQLAQQAIFKPLPLFLLEKAIAAGTVDLTTATTWITDAGYPADQAAAYVATAAGGTVTAKKAETEGMILAEYEAQILSEADATTALESIGYTAAAVPFILESVVARRVLTMRNAAISRIRSAYVVFNITADQATTDLGNLGIPPAAVQQFLTAWTIEQQTNPKRLTAAQVGKLVEDGVLTPTDGVTRWVEMGYVQEEAQLLLDIYPPPATSTTTTTGTTTPAPPATTG